MFYLVVINIFLILICAIIGIGVLNYLENRQPSFTRLGDRLIISIWLGLVALCLSLLTVGFILPVSPLVGFITTLILIILCLVSEQNRQTIRSWQNQLTINHLITATTVIVIASALMSGRVTWIDTGFYHFGSIHWLREHGIVPGIGLINPRFGFISSWFAFSAALNIESLAHHITATANCLILILAIAQCLISIRYIMQGRATIADWFISILLGLTIGILICWSYLRTILVSPSPDIPVLILTAVIAWSVLTVALSTNYSKTWLNATLVPLILSIGIISFKLNTLPLLVTAYLFYLSSKPPQIKKFVMGTLMIGILLMPVIAAGMIITGCPLYPSQIMCLDLPWLLPTQTIAEEMQLINFWQKWSISTWLDYETHKMMLIVAIFSILLLIFGSKYLWRIITRSSQSNYAIACFWTIGLAIFGGGFVFLQSPMIRFALAYLLIIPVFFVALFADQLNLTGKIASQLHSVRTWYQSHFRNSYQFFLVNFSLIILISIIVNHDSRKNLILPAAFPTSKVLIPAMVNDVEFVYAPTKSDDNSIACWGASLPCSYSPLENIKLKDPAQGIAGGFINAK